jgi:pilus assembly protein Flp/PilA
MKGKAFAGPPEGKLAACAVEPRVLLTKEEAMSRLTEILRNQGGATAIEYALVGALISIAALAAMANVGGKVNVMFNNVSNHL